MFNKFQKSKKTIFNLTKTNPKVYKVQKKIIQIGKIPKTQKKSLNYSNIDFYKIPQIHSV